MKSKVKYNVTEDQLPLLDALLQKKVIKRVTFMRGIVNEADPSMDTTVNDFKCVDYTEGLAGNNAGTEWYDYVTTNKRLLATDTHPICFYMNWVRSFELY